MQIFLKRALAGKFPNHDELARGMLTDHGLVLTSNGVYASGKYQVRFTENSAEYGTVCVMGPQDETLPNGMPMEYTRGCILLRQLFVHTMAEDAVTGCANVSMLKELRKTENNSA